MRVGIDARSLRRGPPGVATYVRHLLEELPYLDPWDRTWPRNNLLWNQLWGLWGQLFRQWRLYHAPAYTSPLVNVRPVVLTVHDVAYLARPEWYPYRLDPVRRGYYRRSLQTARRIIVPSRFSRDEITSRFPPLADRVHVVPLGVGKEFYPDPEGARRVAESRRLPERYLLHVGDLHPRRKVEWIIAAGRRLGFPVVLVGRRLAEIPVDLGTVTVLSDLSLEDLRGVYSGAELFVYPSLYEGFGLPLLEAMACGVPVAAVTCGSIPEVCGDAAVLVPPDPEALVEGVREARNRRAELAEAGLRRAGEFSWRRTAHLTEEVYHQACR